MRAALALIEEHGVKGLALSDAAHLAGVSVAAPYRHFKDKEALLAEIAAEGFRLVSRCAGAGTQAHPERQGQAPGGDGRRLCRLRLTAPLALQGDVGERDPQGEATRKWNRPPTRHICCCRRRRTTFCRRAPQPAAGPGQGCLEPGSRLRHADARAELQAAEADKPARNYYANRSICCSTSSRLSWHQVTSRLGNQTDIRLG